MSAQISDTRYTVRLVVDEPELEQRLSNAFQKSPRFDLTGDGKDVKVDLYVVDLPMDDEMTREERYRSIKKWTGAQNDSEVFLLSGDRDPDLLMRAISLGVRAYIPLPLDNKELVSALGDFEKRRLARQVGREGAKNGKIVVFLGSKGGTGVTTIAVNMAVAMAQEKRVALIDMNSVFGEIPQFLDLDVRFTWNEIVQNINRIDDQFLLDTLARHSSGVFILPSPVHFSSDVIVTPEMLDVLLENMQDMFDFILVDAGQSLDSTILQLMRMSDTVVIVSIVSVTCLANTHKLLMSFRKLGYPEEDKIKVVLNRYIDSSSITSDDAEKAIDHPIHWKIPNDYSRTIKAINNGKPFVLSDPKSKISESYSTLIRSLWDMGDKKKKKWRLFGK